MTNNDKWILIILFFPIVLMMSVIIWVYEELGWMK